MPLNGELYFVFGEGLNYTQPATVVLFSTCSQSLGSRHDFDTLVPGCWVTSPMVGRSLAKGRGLSLFFSVLAGRDWTSLCTDCHGEKGFASSDIIIVQAWLNEHPTVPHL